MAIPLAPTSIRTEAYSNSIKVIWRASDSIDVVGYNVYNSQTSGGGISGYTRLNDELIQVYNSVVREVVTSTETITEVGNIRTTTTTDNLETVYYFAHTHENLTELRKQFYVITAVNTDNEESLYSNEINDYPLVIDTEVIDMPRRKKGDVILQYIDDVLRKDAFIDVKPGTVIRDIFIDPHGQEFDRAYVIMNFLRISSSFVSLLAFDDTDGDRVSDAVSDNSAKLTLRSALGYAEDGTEDAELQDLIDNQFDLLASRVYVSRKPATKATGEVTFYTTTPPSADITIDAGTIVSTRAGQEIGAVSFTTLATITFISSQAASYYNSINFRYEIKVAIEATEAGTSGDVPANTVVTTTVGTFKVINELAIFGGTDQESNADLADRATLAYRALDLGTIDGYRKTVIGIHNVEDVEIIDAGHDLMMRDYDEVRRKHIFGKVDIYFQGEELEEFTENFGFLYTRVNNEIVNILQVETGTTNLKIQTTNPDVTTLKPIFNLIEIRNLTQGLSYDIQGNITVFINSVPVIKGKYDDVRVNLTTGQITFNTPLTIGDEVKVKYDAYVAGEVVISSAIGGEVTALLANTGDDGIRLESYIIYKNSTVMVEGGINDYTLNNLTGQISFTLPLATGDQITADYAYILNTEMLIASAIGGETSTILANSPIYSSFEVLSNGTDIEINRFNDINSTIATIATDDIEMSYQFRDAESFILTYQPARAISSVEGSNSGLLIEGIHYTFNLRDDVILEGFSVNAERSVQLVYDANTALPVGNITNIIETIILSGTNAEALTYRSVDASSVMITNQTGTITYAQNIDYILTVGEPNEDVTIQRIETGSITSGQTVLVDYDYGEEIIIKYTTNNLVRKIQDKIDISRHITADVLVKESPATYVDIDLSVKLRPNVDVAVAKSNILTTVSNEINAKLMGENQPMSDIIRVVDALTNVDYVILPLTKMVKANNSIVVRETIGNNIYWAWLIGTAQTYITSTLINKENSTTDGTFTIITEHSGIVWIDAIYNATTGETYTYLSHTTNTITVSGTIAPLLTDTLEVTYAYRTSALNHNTLGNAGNTTQAFGIFEDDEELTLVDTASAVDSDVSQGFIASDGALFISPKNVFDPNLATYRCTYFVNGDTGAYNIQVSDIEHLQPGTISIITT